MESGLRLIKSCSLSATSYFGILCRFSKASERLRSQIKSADNSVICGSKKISVTANSGNIPQQPIKRFDIGVCSLKFGANYLY